MKCPKCGYLGFESVDRCRNCGYDFSLASSPTAVAELPLNNAAAAEAAFADLELGRAPADGGSRTPPDLDLDRLIGLESAETSTPPAIAHDRALAVTDPAENALTPGALPLFSDRDGAVSFRGIAAPRPMGPPLAVRRATPEVPKGRSRSARPPRRDDRPLAFEPAPVELRAAASAAPWREAAHTPRPVPEAASRMARFLAACIDTVLLLAIDAAVLYLTLKIVGLTADDLAVLPVIPMVSFLLLLDGGYLAALTAAGGRTIGKMAAGIRVIGNDGRALDARGALVRAIGSLATILTLGLPYLPALVFANGRALGDRLAGTRVVRAD
ncbi:MAG: RDD family protein [Vicinamibacterales bacterium]